LARQRRQTAIGEASVTRLDRYILQQLVAAFGFFVLVFTGVIWLTQAVRLIDTVVASGQSAGVFLEFSALVLPQVFVIVLPLAGIGAALHALNKLYTDSELIVMMGAGLGPLAMLRPVALFGVLIGLALAIVLTVLVPRSGAILAERTRAIRSDLANALIVERQFLHPLPGLTLFITDTSRQGEMAGIFLNDQRDPAQPVTYSARRALLVREGQEARLVMQEGVALSVGGAAQQLTSVRFDQFVFDLSELLNEETARVARPSEYQVPALLSPTPAMLASGRYDRADFVSEGHYKITMPLLAMIYPMIALVTLLAGGYRRSGFGKRVVVAIVVAALLQILLFSVRARVQERAELWPLMYVPALLGVLYLAALLVRLSRERRPGRAAAGLPA
jgi:lipopolysaccharide export system permease protein